jgi:hypothetical protein
LKKSSAPGEMHGAKLRCTLSLKEMEVICSTISKRRGGGGGAAGPRMGETFQLQAYLHDKR